MDMATALNAKPKRLSPREQSVFDVLKRAQGRYIRVHTIRDEVIPGLPIRNIRKLIFSMRAKGVRVEASGRGIDSKGYRIVEASA